PNPDPTDPDQLFPFKVDGANPPNTSLPTTFSLSNGQTNSTTVFAGTFSAEETTVPTNWVLDSATCDNGNGGTLSNNKLSSITVAADETVTCTFTNKLQLGAIEVTKTGKDKRCTGATSTCQGPSNAFLSGATFEIWKETNGTAGLQTTGSPPLDTLVTSGSTGSNGKKCFDNLGFGGYYAKETVAPTGYQIDNAVSALKTISANGSCPSTGTIVPASFTDTPLSKITISFNSLAGVGSTLATISCSNPTVATENLVEGTPKVLNNLVPDTVTGYTCTVKVDP